MSTLQSLQTWTTFKKFDNHRVASIGFLKYISTGLTLHYTAKKRVINALVQVNLNESDILAVQECIPVISDSTSNNKRILDGNRKDYRFSYFRSIHLPCVIWQRKCKSHYRCLWNSLSTRSRYTFKIDPHLSIHSWSCISFRQPHTFHTIWITIKYWRHYSQEPNNSTESFFGPNRYRTLVSFR